MVSGAPQNPATGMYLYVLIAGTLFILATVTAAVLARKRFGGDGRVGTEPVPPASDGGVTNLAQRLVAGVGGVLLAGVALLFGAQIVTADDGTALLGSREVAVGPDQERVEVGAFFGRVDVVVPEGVRARVAGRVVFGGTECERACSEPGREVVVGAVGAFAMVDVMRPGEVLADEREEAREDAEEAAEDARERAQDARDDD